MAYKPNGKCNACKQIAIERKNGSFTLTKSPLYRQIHSYLLGKIKLSEVHVLYGDTLSYHTLSNHAKHHQTVPRTELARVKVEKAEAETAKMLSKPRHHTERRTNLLDWLQKQVEAGTVKPTASAIVALLKQEADIEAKQTDQAIEMTKLFNAYVANPVALESVTSAEIYHGIPSEVIEGEIVE